MRCTDNRRRQPCNTGISPQNRKQKHLHPPAGKNRKPEKTSQQQPHRTRMQTRNSQQMHRPRLGKQRTRLRRKPHFIPQTQSTYHRKSKRITEHTFRLLNQPPSHIGKIITRTPGAPHQQNRIHHLRTDMHIPPLQKTVKIENTRTKPSRQPRQTGSKSERITRNKHLGRLKTKITAIHRSKMRMGRQTLLIAAGQLNRATRQTKRSRLTHIRTA